MRENARDIGGKEGEEKIRNGESSFPFWHGNGGSGEKSPRKKKNPKNKEKEEGRDGYSAGEDSSEYSFPILLPSSSFERSDSDLEEEEVARAKECSEED